MFSKFISIPTEHRVWVGDTRLIFDMVNSSADGKELRVWLKCNTIPMLWCRLVVTPDKTMTYYFVLGDKVESRCIAVAIARVKSLIAMKESRNVVDFYSPPRRITLPIL